MLIAFQAALGRLATSPSLRFGPILGTRPWPLAGAAEPPSLAVHVRLRPRQPTRPPSLIEGGRAGAGWAHPQELPQAAQDHEDILHVASAGG